MKTFIKIMTLFFMLTVLLNAANPYEPESDDKLNPEMLNTLGAVNILNLTGTDCSGKGVNKFIIVSLPDEAAGKLYMENEVTEVQQNQELTITEASEIKFDPSAEYVGEATFEYSAIDEFGTVDSTPATVTIPIVATKVAAATDTNHTVHGKNCSCKSYTDSSAFSLTFGLLLLVLSSMVGVLFLRRECLA